MELKKYAILIVAVFACVYFSTKSFGDEIQSESLYDLSLTDLLSVKISGVALREQQVLDSPASINVFDHRAIKKMGVTTLIELMRFVPGFQTFRTSESNNQSIAARGRAAAAASREILLIIDGVRIESWWMGASVFHISPVSLEGVKKVEFIRGPVSQIYGSNAFTGVINIETGRAKNSIRTEIGNLDHTRLAASLYLTHDDHRHFLTLDGFSEGGEDYLVADPFGSEERLPISDPKDYLSLGYRWRSPQWSAQVMYIENQSDQFFTGGGVYSRFNSVVIHHYHANLRHKNQWSSQLSTNLSIGYKSLVNYFEIPFTGSRPFAEGLVFPPSEAPIVGFAEEDTYEYWADGNLLYEFTGSLDIQAGFELRLRGVNDVIGTTNYDLIAVFNGDFPVESSNRAEFPALVGEATEESQVGLFSTLTYKAGNTQLSFGGRFDDYEIIGSQFTPRISAVVKLNPENALKFIYGEAFRSPAHIELFTDNNLVFRGNPSLNPEVVNTFEVIWHQETKTRRLQLGWFYNQFEDTIGVDVRPSGLREYVNFGESMSQGWEFSWTESLSDLWTARVVASDLLHKPDDMFRLADETANFLLSLWLSPWTVTTDVAYTSGRKYLHLDGDIRPIDSYTLLNLHASYAVTPRLELNFTTLNAIDESYAGPSEGISADSIPARGIQLKAGFEYHF